MPSLVKKNPRFHYHIYSVIFWAAIFRLVKDFEAINGNEAVNYQKLDRSIDSTRKNCNKSISLNIRQNFSH